MKRTEGLSYSSDNRYRSVYVMSAMLFIALITVIMAFFFVANRHRVINQNKNYLSDAVKQKIVNFHEKVDDNLDIIKTVSYLYGRAVVKDGEVNLRLLKELEDNIGFDYVRFIDADGIDHTAEGKRADCSDRPYFIDGMKGRCGTVVVVSRVNGAILLGSYAPVRYNGKIIGIMVGFYNKSRIDEMLRCKYFGFDPQIIWMTSDGGVFSALAEIPIGNNFFDFLEKHDFVDAENFRIIREAVRDNREASFLFRDENGRSCGYIVPLNICGDFLVETFPTGATEMLIDNVNWNAWKFLGVLIAIFLVYLSFVAGYEINERRKFDASHRRFRIISYATEKILDNFVYVDLRNNTYEYFASNTNYTIFENSGSFSDYIESFADIQSSAEEAENIRRSLAKENLVKALAVSCDSFMLLSHIKKHKEIWRTVNVVCTERSEDGAPLGVLLIMQDTTAWQSEQLRQSKLIREALQQAESASQAKSVFLSKMSHDMRTPMNGILGMTAIAMHHLDERDRVCGCLQKINTAGSHLLSLMNEVLDMTKIESGSSVLNSQDFSLSDLIDDLLSAADAGVKARGHKLKVDVSALRHENVVGDALKLRQCLTNLLENAVNYTPDGGCIEFRAAERDTDKKGWGRYEFVVKDNGLGISAEQRKKIFEPFFRGEDTRINKVYGTGLGLAIADNIVRMMGGSIELESEPNKGSAFTVTCFLKLGDEEAGAFPFAGREALLVSRLEAFFKPVSAVLNGLRIKSVNCGADSLGGEAPLPSLTEGRELAVLVDAGFAEANPAGIASLRKKIKANLPFVLVGEASNLTDEVKEIGFEGSVLAPLFRSKFVQVFESLTVSSDVSDKPFVELSEMNLSDKRILLAEDNDLNAEIAAEILEMTGVRTERAENGAEAVRMVSEADPGYYDLIFMDIQMPVMNGHEAARAIRALEDGRGAKLPIVAMSANAFAEDIKASEEAGMDGHIAKPIDLKILEEALNRWLLS